MVGVKMPFGQGSTVLEELMLVSLSDHSLDKAAQIVNWFHAVEYLAAVAQVAFRTDESASPGLSASRPTCGRAIWARSSLPASATSTPTVKTTPLRKPWPTTPTIAIGWITPLYGAFDEQS
jgi:hypothetical protein